jgi:hypothetical protein
MTGDTIVTDKPDTPKQIPPATVTVTDTGIAPFVFFEGAPSFGFNHGVVCITLAAGRHLLKEGLISSDVIAVAHLRCGVRGAMELRNALDNALSLATKAEGKAH